MSRSVGDGREAPLLPMYQKLLAMRRRDCSCLSEAKVTEILGEFRQGPADDPHGRLQTFLGGLIQGALDPTRATQLRRSNFLCLRWVLGRIDDAVRELTDSEGRRQVTPTESDDDSAAGVEAATAIPRRLQVNCSKNTLEVPGLSRKRRLDWSTCSSGDGSSRSTDIPERQRQTSPRQPGLSSEQALVATGVETSAPLLDNREQNRDSSRDPPVGPSAFAPTQHLRPTERPTSESRHSVDGSIGNHVQGQDSLQFGTRRGQVPFQDQTRVERNTPLMQGTDLSVDGRLSSRDAPEVPHAGFCFDSYGAFLKPVRNQGHRSQDDPLANQRMNIAHPHSVEPGTLEMVLCADDISGGQRINYSCTSNARPCITVSFSQENLPPSIIQHVFHRLDRWDPFWRIESVAQVGRTFTGVKRKMTGEDGTIRYVRCPLKTALRLQSRPRRDLRQRDQPCIEPSWGEELSLEADKRVVLFRMLPVDFKDKNRADCHLWPRGTFLQIDGQPVSLEQRRQRTDYRDKWAGHCKSLNVTRFAKIATEVMRFEMCCYDGEPYYFCLAICSFQPPSRLLPSLLNANNPKSLKRLSRVDGIEQAKKALNNYNEGEVVHVDAKFTFSLFCPISKSAIKDPVRGKQCKHCQCFDLTAFLESNVSEGSLQRWRCAICSNFIPVEDLLICEFTFDLLREFPEATKQDLVEFSPDGTYKLIREQALEIVDLT